MRRHHPKFPHSLKSLSLISMPLGLLHRLLPNKHRQDLLQCLLHLVCCAHLSLPIHLPPFMFLFTFCFCLSLLSSLLKFSCSSIQGLLVLSLRSSVSSVVFISPEDILSPRVGNVKLVTFLFFFLQVRINQMEEKQQSEVVNVCCKSRGHMVEIRR